MNGARFVHDTLELAGWDVEIADALEGQGPRAPRRQDRPDRRPGPRRARPAGTSCPRSGCPTRPSGPSASGPASGSTSSATGRRSRTGSTPPSSPSATRCPVSRPVRDGRAASCSARLAIPEPWATTLATSLRFVDELGRRDRRLRAGAARAGRRPPVRRAAADRARHRLGAGLHDRRRDRRHRPVQQRPRSSPGTPGCAPSCASRAARDDRGPLAKNGPKYLRWALIEAATHAARHPALPASATSATRSASAASAAARSPGSSIARELATAIWHMLTQARAVRSRQAPRDPLVA